MTKEELTAKYGADQAEYAMLLVMKQVTPAFVRKAAELELKDILSKIEGFSKDGYIYTVNGAHHVDWTLPEKVYGNEPGAAYHATKEQEDEWNRRYSICCAADIALYHRNRLVDILAR